MNCDDIGVRLFTFLRFALEIKGKKPVDIEKIHSMGLLAVKLGQICALRPDLIDPQKCIELQKLYSRAPSIPEEGFDKLLTKYTGPDFRNNFNYIETKPFAAASIGQIHRAELLDGTKVVIKLIKADFESSFRKDIRRMKRWFRIGLLLNPR